MEKCLYQIKTTHTSKLYPEKDPTGGTNSWLDYKEGEYVFDEIMKNKSKFNDAQIKDAQDYMNRVIIKCERLNIDIKNIN
ncbi:hypothetical protein J0383_05265 [Flavobacterium endoglycinae]|uniref:Tox-MPTase4 domain-containing protein n=1 Tax=Flavobacterium endoglycinae TaxID=2816357 RepID=A0ABX7QGM3_9FLAO|nr:zincin-like metallopeptidase toxin domain-containing protein [Flavobacterium endoglycinae]QSW90229.1 hypothetical protein J0383_05265 [Flavobacterium endoglycinae]